MQITPQTLRLSPEENQFLQHWMYDESRYMDGPGAAKQLQVRHGIAPADLGLIIAAALPNPADQQKCIYEESASGPVEWPWTEDSFQARVAEARKLLQGSAFRAEPVSV